MFLCLSLTGTLLLSAFGHSGSVTPNDKATASMKTQQAQTSKGSDAYEAEENSIRPNESAFEEGISID